LHRISGASGPGFFTHPGPFFFFQGALLMAWMPSEGGTHAINKAVQNRNAEVLILLVHLFHPTSFVL